MSRVLTTADGLAVSKSNPLPVTLTGGGGHRLSAIDA